MFNQMKSVLSIILLSIATVVFITYSASAGSSTLALNSSLAPQSNTAVSTSGTVITVSSDLLANSTNNAIIFDINVTSGSGYTIRGANVSTTAPKSSLAVETAVVSTAQNIVKTFSIPVDQVAFGASNTVFNVVLEAFGSPDGDAVATCAQANILNASFPFNYECQTTTLTVTVTPLSTGSSADTGAVVNNFLRRRSGGILSNEPDIHKQLDDDGNEINSVGYRLSETQGGFDASFNAQTNRVLASQFGHGYKVDSSSARTGISNLWINGALSRTKQNGQSQDFGIVHLGAGYKISSELLVGGILQIDRASENDTSVGASVSGTGWMIGPYLVARLRDNILFDGRVAYGQSSNKVSPTGTYTDNFDTSRALIKARITGEYYHNDVKISPLLSLIYFSEKQNAYVDSLNATIPEQTVNLGQITFGSNFSKEITLKNGMVMTPNAAIKGVWNFKDTGFLNAATGAASTLNNAEISARLDFGVDIKNDNGMNVDIGGFFDGIATSNYQAYGGSAKLTVKF